MSVGIVGLGYVGLPLAVAFAEEGEDVVALDVDQRKIDAIAAGDSYVEDIPSERLRAVADRITPTLDAGALADVEAILICVPTPLTENREPDLGPLLEPLLNGDAKVVFGSRSWSSHAAFSFWYVVGNKGVTMATK